jgi:hypothetical protein
MAKKKYFGILRAAAAGLRTAEALKRLGGGRIENFRGGGSGGREHKKTKKFM